MSVTFYLSPLNLSLVGSITREIKTNFINIILVQTHVGYQCL